MVSEKTLITLRDGRMKPVIVPSSKTGSMTPITLSGAVLRGS